MKKLIIFLAVRFMSILMLCLFPMMVVIFWLEFKSKGDETTFSETCKALFKIWKMECWE